MAGEKIPLGKYWRPILIILVIVIAIWLATVSGAVLIPFLLGVLIAYLLMPLVRWLEKRLPPKGKGERAKRICSVAIVFVGLLVKMVLFMTYIGSIVISASGVLIEKAPVLLSKSTEQIGNWIKDLRMVVPQAWLIQLDATMQDLGPQAGKYIQDFAIGAMSIIPASLPTIMSFLILPFFLFFMMMDYDAFRKFFYDYMPSKSAKQAGDILTIIGDVMGRYIRSTLILSLIVGVMVWIGLWLLGIQYAPALGAITAVTQFIPIVGPFVSGFAVVIITLALHPDKLLWALLIFIAAQMVLNMVFANWIQGKYMQIHPAVIMVILMVGGFIAGFWGMILALPIAATIWEIFKYYRGQQPSETPLSVNVL